MIPSKEWLDAFDTEVKRLYCTSVADLGWDEIFLGHWCDLSPREAAEKLGEKYDLIIISIDHPYFPYI